MSIAPHIIIKTTMALDKCGLNTNSKNKELKPHGTFSFPCAGYKSTHTDSISSFITWHYHDEFEIIYILEGTLELNVETQKYYIHKGEVAIINSNKIHSGIGHPFCKLESLVFSSLLISGTIDSSFATKYINPLISCMSFSCAIFDDQEDNFVRAFDALKNDSFAYEFIVRENISHIMLEVYKKYENSINVKQLSSNLGPNKVLNMLDYIHQNYSQDISLEDLADVSNISKREVLRLFKKVIGETPIQYLLKYRLIQSASMLKEDKTKSVAQIALDCGFESFAYFSKKFKEFYLVTPSKYRNF